MSEAYSTALRALLANFMAAIEDPTHRLRTALKEGLFRLEIALEATRQANGRRAATTPPD